MKCRNCLHLTLAENVVAFISVSFFQSLRLFVSLSLPPLISVFITAMSLTASESLFFHCSTGNISSVESLLSSPCCRSQINLNSFHERNIGCFLEFTTCLLVAIEKGSDQIVELLLNAGADANLLSVPMNLFSFGVSPLYAASRNSSNVRIMELLLRNGSNPNILDRGSNRTPLMTVASLGIVEMASLLVRHGAHVNQTINGSDLETPLHVAARWSHPKMIGFLLDSGAQVDALDNRRHTPLYQAATRGDIESCTVLLSHGANPSLYPTLLHDCMQKGHIQVVNCLLNFGARLGEIDYRNGSVALHVAKIVRSPPNLHNIMNHYAFLD